MVKSYLRYEECNSFGVVVSAESNLCYDSTGKLLIAGALDKLLVWNVKQGLCVHSLAPSLPESGSRPAVTAIACTPASSSLVSSHILVFHFSSLDDFFRLLEVASGYSDGSLRIWDIVKGACESTMNSHRGAVTALRYNKNGSLLATGSKDTDVIVWDTVGETGLFRLQGHRDQVTDVVFIENGNKLLTSSKDTFVRVWDIQTQACVQTIVSHRSEVWSLDVDPLERYVVTGGADMELRLFQVSSEPSSDPGKWEVLQLLGDVKKQSHDRVVTLRFNELGTLLGCQCAGKSLEVYSLHDDKEALKKAKRRKRRKREKADKTEKPENVAVTEPEDGNEFQASDYIRLLQIVRLKHKARSFAISPLHSRKEVMCTLAVSLHNNSLEVHEVQAESSAKVHSIDLPGHRSDVRSAVLTMDGTLLLTTSHNAVKIWNPTTGSCLRTMEAGYGLCGLFGPGNHHAIVGTKTGALEIFDVRSGERVRAVEAHSGAVWSVSALPNGEGFVTGSADNDVKFWRFDLVQADDKAFKQLTIENVRTLRMAEDVLAVRVSPDGKYLAVALLDSTVKIFFTDSLKFYLSLYGHKLPVLCIDISSDGALLASGSADKNMKIWGMDFGDCHKSLFAHHDSVMALKFVPNTHYIFSVGKDRVVNYWDADKFQHLLRLEGHHAEIWCLAVSFYGDFIITGSHDRSIRRWERTEEPFFIEEEREKQLEARFDSELDDSRAPRQEAPEEGASGLAGRKTQDTVSAADSIIDALDLAEEERKKILEHKEAGEKTKFQPNVMMLGLSPAAYVLRAVTSVRPSDLEQAFLMLPFSDALKLLEYVKQWIPDGSQVEIVGRVATMLLRIHHEQLIATPSARAIVTSVQEIHGSVRSFKNVLGRNIAAMSYVQDLLALSTNALFKDAGAKLSEIRKKLSSFPEKQEGHNKNKKRQKLQ
ncbi:WD repeat-containing protein 3 isoform X1 [Selaginella moellendorffii]|uniref:WD repeat-containing protein 3 isoform X1 n=1 Tax=Selaginella moellendorffii TaxID=88036 RepID=UPI000D1CD6F0|nr:WD repeat-containing protein 3 isoform X1 [Selaginella moellendorffii]|eukprot:XP_024544362.1 WD repeat-containing protein 3 isoform X1 [Selaginella moellendorffii]